LVLGPLAMVLGAVARLRGNKVPGFTGQGPTAVTMVLGATITVTQWAGVILMVVYWPWAR
jgi:hypothetical protein